MINIEQGLVDAGFTITTNAWLDVYDEMLKTAKAAHQAEINRLAEENHQPPFIIEFERPFKEPGSSGHHRGGCEGFRYGYRDSCNRPETPERAQTAGTKRVITS